MSRKLILPAEAKVCATCSFWDGERQVDTDVGVVVVADGAAGECLVRETDLPGLLSSLGDTDCEWEHLAPDETTPEDDAPGKSGSN